MMATQSPWGEAKAISIEATAVLGGAGRVAWQGRRNARRRRFDPCRGRIESSVGAQVKAMIPGYRSARLERSTGHVDAAALTMADSSGSLR
jgi:hypothetical protein